MKITAIIVATFMAVASVAAAADHTSRELIVGGTFVKNGTNNHVCGFRRYPDRRNVCVGALIDKKTVITTAACASLYSDDNPMYVSCGTTNLRGIGDGEQIKVVKVQNHPHYNSRTGVFDVALVTLETPSNITAINLPNPDGSDIGPETVGMVVGWGATAKGQNYSEHMLTITLPVVDVELCVETNEYFTDANFCAGGKKGIDVCDGDIGAAFIKRSQDGSNKDILIGLTSAFGNCGEYGNIPTLFERVSSSIKWILATIGDSDQKGY